MSFMPNDPVRKLLSELADRANQNAAIVEAALKLAHSHRLSSSDHLDPWLQRFVEVSLHELQARYMKLFSQFWTDEAIARTKFEQYVRSFFESEPEWPWPITEPGPGEGGSSSDIFKNEHSGLWLCGYRVGKTKGLVKEERKRFLEYFFSRPLPPVVAKYHNEDYGAPGSEKRLRKMANVMASCCRNFKLVDPKIYRFAISHYEEDLEFLRKSYYRAGMFPWPPID